MAYNYATERGWVFSEDGQVTFLKIRDAAKKFIDQAGAVTSGKLLGVSSGDAWHMLACIDRLVELKELIEIPNPISQAGQHRIFIAPYNW